jgi:hypothetical protein
MTVLAAGAAFAGLYDPEEEGLSYGTNYWFYDTEGPPGYVHKWAAFTTDTSNNLQFTVTNGGTLGIATGVYAVSGPPDYMNGGNEIAFQEFTPNWLSEDRYTDTSWKVYDETIWRIQHIGQDIIYNGSTALYVTPYYIAQPEEAITNAMGVGAWSGLNYNSTQIDSMVDLFWAGELWNQGLEPAPDPLDLGDGISWMYTTDDLGHNATYGVNFNGHDYYISLGAGSLEYGLYGDAPDDPVVPEPATVVGLISAIFMLASRRVCGASRAKV